MWQVHTWYWDWDIPCTKLIFPQVPTTTQVLLVWGLVLPQSGWLFKTMTSTSLYTRVPAWYPPNIGRYSIVMKNVRSNYTKTFFWWEIWYPGQVVKISRTSLALPVRSNSLGGKKKNRELPNTGFFLIGTGDNRLLVPLMVIPSSTCDVNQQVGNTVIMWIKRWGTL